MVEWWKGGKRKVEGWIMLRGRDLWLGGLKGEESVWDVVGREVFGKGKRERVFEQTSNRKRRKKERKMVIYSTRRAMTEGK